MAQVSSRQTANNTPSEARQGRREEGSGKRAKVGVALRRA